MVAFYNDGPFNLTSGEDLIIDRLVKMSGATAVYADAGEDPVGITAIDVLSGAVVSNRVLDGSVRKVTGSKAISAGAAIYVTTDGKVSDAAVGNQIGILLGTAITANGGKAAAIVWGTRGGSDQLSAIGGSVNFFDDFFRYDNTATVGGWAEVSDSGTIANIDGANGVLSIASGGTAQNESYVSSLTEIFLFTTTKKLFFEARVKLTEANVNDANIIVGLSDTVAADSLLDAGAGPMASYDGAVFFKVFDGTVWQGETSNAGSQETDTNVGAFSDGAWTKLGFLYDFNDGTTAQVTFYVDGVAGGTLDLVISGLEEMHILLGLKSGGANAEALLTDYVHVATAR